MSQATQVPSARAAAGSDATAGTVSEAAAVSATGDDRVINRLIRTFIGVAVAGWGASMLLTAIHFWVLPLPAGAEPQGAIQVITSQWAYVGPIPLATIGALYYIVMIAAGATWLHTKDARLERALLPLTSLGVLASAGFVYLQFVPIGAICPFCMVSAAATTTLLLLEVVVRRRGGAAAAPVVPAVRVWPAAFVATMAVTMLVLWAIPQLPLPGN
ncbi:MAG: vitamin K epoxide reductase family protein [Nitriliruptor sp.]|nr:MAG: vitamin K epoxide reductase family protein [Nitriliruptor sp.]